MARLEDALKTNKQHSQLSGCVSISGDEANPDDRSLPAGRLSVNANGKANHDSAGYQSFHATPEF